MSHELRTPLNAMLGFAQLLELDRAASARRGASGRGSRRSSRPAGTCCEMINDMLDLSRIESGNAAPAASSALDLQRRCCQATAAHGRSDARAARHRGSTQALGRRRRRRARRRDARQADPHQPAVATPSSTTSTAAASTSRSRLARGRRGRDRRSPTPGMGMTPEQMRELFQPFNRLGRERTALEGTGIGLVISRRLAELMGGSLAGAAACPARARRSS